MSVSEGGGFNQRRGKGVLQPEAEGDFSRDHGRACLLLFIFKRNSLPVCDKSLQFVAEKNKEAGRCHDCRGKGARAWEAA